MPLFAGTSSAVCSGMRTIVGAALAGSLLVPARAAAPPAATAADAAFAPVHVLRERDEVRGTAVLVHLDRKGREVVLYLLTSSRLFNTADGGRDLPPRRITLLLEGTRPIEVKPHDLFVPAGDIVDVAVIRVTTEEFTAAPKRVVYEPPPAGTDFAIGGYDTSGAAISLQQRIRFESTLIAIGDRDGSALAGCLGAPAMTPAGVFGLVSDCPAGRCPTISLLAVARAFIERHVPRLTSSRRLPQLPSGERL